MSITRHAVWLFALGLCRCAPTCEEVAAGQDYARTAQVCERAYFDSHRPADAMATLRALTWLRRYDELEAKAGWLQGTSQSPSIDYFRGMVSRFRGDDEKAGEQLRASLAAATDAGQKDAVARAAQQLASLQWTHSEFQPAFANLALAMEQLKDFDDPMLAAVIDGQLADLLGETGDLDGKARALDLVARRFKTFSPIGFAQTRLRQGAVEHERGNRNLARSYFQTALEVATQAAHPSTMRAALVNLGDLAREERDYDAGTAQLDAAARIPAFRPYERTTLDYSRALLLEDTGACERATEVLAGALDAGPLPDWQWKLLTLAGRCHRQLHRPDAARLAYEQATQTIDQMRAGIDTEVLSRELVRVRREPYESLFELAVERHDTGEALLAMERLLGRSFLQAVASPQRANNSDLTEATELAARRVELLTAFAAYSPGAASLDELTPQAGARSVVAFVVARGQVYRAVLAHGTVRFSNVWSATDLAAAIESSRAHPDDLPLAELLGAHLWPDGVLSSEVIVVADNALAGLSFAGLRHGGQWLVSNHVVSYAPSLSTAVAMLSGQPRASPTTDATVFGDPSGDLPNARAEAIVLGKRLGSGAVVGEQATRAQFEAACRSGLLHFAGHSGFGVDGPWLALADGQLSAGRLLRIKCGPPIVYLASCASGLGNRNQPAITLAGTFLAAGSRHVVATTRAIDDHRAAEFSRAYFEFASVDPPPLAVARAQRQLLLTQPRSAWEPFVVLGP